ncbi:MAG: hypothetical protein R3275_09005 [Saprospiraceae bacterium]|nr:hypothetical protein [Saprospiraceae bacterium]
MDATIITKPKVEIDPEIRRQLRTKTDEEGQVIVHCLYRDRLPWGSAIRIWPTTYLLDCDSDHKSELVHTENISLYPSWTPCDPFSDTHFTLIFTGLPRTCTKFDFEEFCDNSGGEFVARNIPRNSSDIYYLVIL